MKTADITFRVVIPDESATEQEVIDWIRFSLGEVGSIKVSNPLASHELEAEFNSVIVDI